MGKMTFDLFAEANLDKIFKIEEELVMLGIKNELVKKPPNINEKELIEKYYNEHHFEPLKIDFNNMEASQYIDKKSKMMFYVYCLPFTGDRDLLKYNPSTGIMGWTIKVFLKGNHFCFEKETYAKNPENFKGEIDETIEVIREEIIKIKKDVEEYNVHLMEYIKKIIKEGMKGRKN